MAVYHVCKFPAEKASRLKMQSNWCESIYVDRSGNEGTILLSFFGLLKILNKKNAADSVFIFHMQSALPYLMFVCFVND